MKVIDPGHLYDLDLLDADVHGSMRTRELRFVKRVGDKFPGNEPPAYEGTTAQEVLRALIDRTIYVDGQEHHDENDNAIEALRDALCYLEARAAKVRGDLGLFRRQYADHGDEIESMPTCADCGHIACSRHP